MQISDWISQIDKTTVAFQEVCRGLSADDLNWKPTADQWSIGQNLEHLIVINESYYPVLEQVRSGHYKLPFLGQIGFIVKFFGNTILKSVQPDRKRKMKTFPIWEPSESKLPGDILKRFAQHQEELKKVITTSKDLVEKDVVISSPANKNIVYKLKTAFDIIVVHEQRHLEQAREVRFLMERK